MVDGDGIAGGDGAASEPVHHRHILVVEDDRDLAALLQRWIRDHYGESATVHLAHTVEEGREVIAAMPTVDVVLLDRHFPEGRGEDLLDRLHASFDPIVVMVTGIEPTTELIRFPVADYLVKPIDRPALIKRLAMLEKLDTSGALEAYSNARKASLLEFHLDDPDADPLFRRFAARWTYDRLEVAVSSDAAAVYELYNQGEGNQRRVVVSVIGELTSDLQRLVDDDELAPVGEVVPTADGPVWIDVDRPDVVDPPTGGYTVYAFTGELPERHVAAAEVAEAETIEAALEQAYA